MKQKSVYAIAAVGFVIAAGVGVVLANGQMPPAQPVAGQKSGETHACVFSGEDGDPEAYCLRQAADHRRRTRLTEAQSVQVNETAAAIMSLPNHACPIYPGHQCAEPGLSRIEVVLRPLREAGHTAVARFARDTDPAPEGLLLHAVEVGDYGCVIKWKRENGSGGGMQTGRLPNGRCLDDQVSHSTTARPAKLGR